MAESFPSAFYGERLRKQIGSLNNLAYVAHRDVSNEYMKVFGTQVETIWFYSAVADQQLYLAVHRDSNGKIVFLEYPVEMAVATTFTCQSGRIHMHIHLIGVHGPAGLSRLSQKLLTHHSQSIRAACCKSVF